MTRTDTTTLVREVVASAQIHGGTRVVELSAFEPEPGHFVVVEQAYDSNHSGDVRFCASRSGSDLTAQLAEMREHASYSFGPRSDPDVCDCWLRWDLDCGRPGCWGVPRAGVLGVAAGAGVWQ